MNSTYGKMIQKFIYKGYKLKKSNIDKINTTEII